ncbi:MAG: hypothetical protein Q4C52_00555 [Eubacteriales bacterium]|nr:hypothetical protein [Eubacteriales bacterium]
MEKNRLASSIPACNMIIALLIFAQIPIMFGIAAPNAVIFALPWILAAFPIILICVVIMYKNGEFVDATLNAILSGVLMGQNFVRGMIALQFVTSGREVSQELILSSYAIDKWVYLAGGVILLFAGWLASFQCKMAAIGVWAGAVGFLALAAMYHGIGNIFGMIGAIGLVILGIYLLYSGIAILVNTAMQKEVMILK